MNNKTVSVIIPTYNGSRTIAKTVRSVLSQSRPVDEIIVVDDGSTDETLSMLGKFPVSVIRRQNGGPGAARNTGANASTGEFLAFLDHDDTWHVDKTERQLASFSNDIGAVFCEKIPNSDGLGFEDLFRCNFAGNPSGTIVRKSVFQKLGGFDESPGVKGVDDYDFWLKFLFNGFKYRTTPNLYDFTPADDHYGGRFDKMFSAEAVVLRKAREYSGLSGALLRDRLCELQVYALKRSYSKRDVGSMIRTLAPHLTGPFAREFWKYFLKRND